MPDHRTARGTFLSLGLLVSLLASCSSAGQASSRGSSGGNGSCVPSSYNRCDGITSFEVRVYLNRGGQNPVMGTTLESTYNCLLAVYADGKQIKNASTLDQANGTPMCRPGITGDDRPMVPEGLYLGDFGFRTDRPSGTVQFVVTMVDYETHGLAQGSVEADVAPGGDRVYPLIVDTCRGDCPIMDMQ